MYWSRHAVRLRKETWIEILSKLIIAHCYKGSSPKGDVIWNIFSGANSLGFFCSSPCGDVSWNIVAVKRKKCHWEFVSLRRRELKYHPTPPSSSPLPVRLLTETWVEMSHQQYPFVPPTGSSPYGDVSWNILSVMSWMSKKKFVSLRRRELKYVFPSPLLWISTFVSLRRRELKYLQELLNPHLPSSSPYGDVSWNEVVRAFHWCICVRLLPETWIEIFVMTNRMCQDSFIPARGCE